MRDKIISSDYCVTDKLGPPRTLIIIPFQHATCARRTAHEYFILASKGLTLEGFTTFMDCCLRKELAMRLGMRWIISEASIECQ